MQGSICCGYGSLGVMTSGYDCVMIPGATKAADKAPVPNSICGQGKGLVTVVAGMTTATVCSKYSQFYSMFGDLYNKLFVFSGKGDQLNF